MNTEQRPAPEDDPAVPTTRRRSRTKIWVTAIAIVSAVVGTSTVAIATPGSGTALDFKAVATIDDLDVKFKVDGHRGKAISRVNGPGKVWVARLTVEPGGSTGWHFHDGPIMVVVKTGALTLYDADCRRQQYTAGQAFLDPAVGPRHAHIARNEGTEPVEAWVTFLLPADATSRVDVSEPPADCGF